MQTRTTGSCLPPCSPEADASVLTLPGPPVWQALTAALLFHKPEDPTAFLIDLLKGMEHGQTDTLVTDEDLETMFGMFDVTGKGAINVSQTNQALRTLVGDSATMVVDEGKPVTRQDFVNSCRGELNKTVG